RQAIDDYLLQRGGGSSPYLFPGCGPAGHLTTRQYARLLAEWLTMIGLDPGLYGTHSLRRTKATLISKKTGNLRAVQLLLGHRKIESTVRYLGIEVDDALAVAEQIDVRTTRAELTRSARPGPVSMCHLQTLAAQHALRHTKLRHPIRRHSARWITGPDPDRPTGPLSDAYR